MNMAIMQWQTGHMGIWAMPGGPVHWVKSGPLGCVKNCRGKLLLNIKRSPNPRPSSKSAKIAQRLMRICASGPVKKCHIKNVQLSLSNGTLLGYSVSIQQMAPARPSQNLLKFAGNVA